MLALEHLGMKWGSGHSAPVRELLSLPVAHPGSSHISLPGVGCPRGKREASASLREQEGVRN